MAVEGGLEPRRAVDEKRHVLDVVCFRSTRKKIPECPGFRAIPNSTWKDSWCRGRPLCRANTADRRARSPFRRPRPALASLHRCRRPAFRTRSWAVGRQHSTLDLLFLKVVLESDNFYR